MAVVTGMTSPALQDTGCSASYITLLLSHFWFYRDMFKLGPVPLPSFLSYVPSFLSSFHFLSFFLNIALGLLGHLNLRIGVSQIIEILCLLFFPPNGLQITYMLCILCLPSLLTCPSHDFSLSLSQSVSKKVTCRKPKNCAHTKFSEVVVKISASKLSSFSSTSL